MRIRNDLIELDEKENALPLNKKETAKLKQAINTINCILLLEKGLLSEKSSLKKGTLVKQPKSNREEIGEYMRNVGIVIFALSMAAMLLGFGFSIYATLLWVILTPVGAILKSGRKIVWK